MDIMGHSDIQTTMNIYAEVTVVKKQESMMALWKNSFDERHIVVYN